jgi:hypothetical protein
MKNPHTLGTRILKKTFATSNTGQVPMAASLFSMAVKQTFKSTKVLMFEQVGRNFYVELKVSVYKPKGR